MKKIIIIIFIILINNVYAQFPNTLSNTDKIYGLSKFWQEVNYNFVYLNKIDRKKWNNDYKNLITEVQETKNDFEYYLLLKKFCATLNDGHTYIFYPDAINDNIYINDFGNYKLYISNIEGKAIITKINFSKKDEIPIGSEIIKVNGINTSEYIKDSILPYISASTNFVREDIATEKMFLGQKGKEYKIKIKLPNNKEKELLLIHKETTETKLYPIEKKVGLMEFKKLKNNIVYIKINSFSNSSILKQFLDSLSLIKKANGLIIDLRENYGGNSSISKNLAQFLTTDTILNETRNQCRQNISTYKAWGAYIKEKDTIKNHKNLMSYLSYRDEYFYKFPYEPYIIPKGNREYCIKKPTVILTGHSTASSAENFLLYLDNQKNIVRFGEKTYGSTGQPFVFTLPGGGYGQVCTKKVTYSDGREFVGIGIIPHKEIKPTLSDFRNKYDRVLQEAVKYLLIKK